MKKLEEVETQSIVIVDNKVSDDEKLFLFNLAIYGNFK